MNLGLITIGNELLNGTRLDTNSAWIGENVIPKGGRVVWRLSIGDEYEQIFNALNSIPKNINAIITTGGLGPTHDDITLKVLCDYFKTKLIFDEPYWKKLKSRFKQMNKNISESNKSQALFPETGDVIDNPIGSARGVHLTNQQFHLFALPGVPAEMKAIMKDSILPWVGKHSNLSIHSHLIRTTGIMESSLFEKMKKYLDLNKEVSVAYLPRLTGVDIRLTSIDKKKLMNFIERINLLIGKYVYANSDTDIEKIIGNILIDKKQSIAIAESCTGGLIADRITRISGSSQYFFGGIVAYSNAIKHSILNVQNKTLEKYGAVSEQTAMEMAIGVKNKFNADIGLSSTGIAGPNGGTKNKPVGLIFIGIAINSKIMAFKFNFSNERVKNKLMASQAALTLLYKHIKK